MQVEHGTTIEAAPEQIFPFYEDVAHWHTWDPDTRSATLDGPFQVGTRGRLTPTQGNTVPMLITHVEPNRSFTVECKIPLFRMVFEHELKPSVASTQVVHRVRFSGLLTPILGRLLCKRIDQGLPHTLARLKQQAEARRPA